MYRFCWLLIAVGSVMAGLLATGERPSTTNAYWGANGNIAYAGEVGPDYSGIPGIWVLGTTIVDEPVQITTGAYPDWSPDGKRILFVRDGVGIQSANADGTGQVHLAGVNDTAYMYPRWAPDGARIAYFDSIFACCQSLVISKPDGSDKHTVAPSVEYAGLAWSPDGTEIAAIALDEALPDPIYALFAFKTDGSGDRRKISNRAGRWPDWSADGRFILGSGGVPEGAEGKEHVFLINALGDSNPKDLGEGSQPRWSPDGEKIAFARLADLSSNPAFPLFYPVGGISIMNADGSGRFDLTSFDRDRGIYGGSPAWQPIPGVQVEFTQAIQQLQTVVALKADLEDDGAPPVPIVAGKPAAMRVYFPQFDHTTQRTVEVSGIVNDAVPVILDRFCTLEDRRRSQAYLGCLSVNFYFTPPEGAWSVTMRILDEAGVQLQEDTFNFVSPKTDSVLLKAVSVCHDMNPVSGAWSCQDASPLVRDVSLLRRILPTAEVSVLVTGDVVRRDVDDFTAPAIQCNDKDGDDRGTACWWERVDIDVEGLYNETDKFFAKTGEDIYYLGMVWQFVEGGYLGLAGINTHGAVAKASTIGDSIIEYQWVNAVVAHEIGHAMGLDHTDTAQPKLSGIIPGGCWLGKRHTLPPYPYADNLLRSGDGLGDVEIGFDVASGIAVPGDQYYEIMGYCAQSPPNRAPDITQWISQFSTLQLLQPNALLSSVAAAPAARLASGPADYWLVRGSLDGPTHVNFEPLIKVTSEGQVGTGSGNYRIEVRDGANAMLYTRSFRPVTGGHASPSPDQPLATIADFFTEAVPVQADAASIEVFDPGQALIGHIDMGGAAPSVAITLPQSFQGAQTISWSVTDPDSTEHFSQVDYSPDGGQTWQHQAQGLKQTSLTLDFGMLAGSDGQGVFRVIASDGVNSGEATSTPFSVADNAPHAEITGPSGGSFRSGNLVWLEASAWDTDDGTLDNGAVMWTSSRDGNLGNGASLPVYDLSVGTHTITMTAHDSDNNTATDTITVTITDGPIVEAGAIADMDCSGSIAAPDALVLLLHLAGLHPDSCQTIGSGEPVAFGDADCDGVIGPGDVVAILALQADVPRGCV